METLKGKKTRHPEAIGFLSLLLSIFSFFSIASFSPGAVYGNWLGPAGYYAGFGLHYLFGFGSFALVAFGIWCSAALLIKKEIFQFKWKCLYFLLFLCSISLLLNLCAEIGRAFSSFLSKHCLSQEMAEMKKRVYLGGVPAYGLLADLHKGSLLRLLRPFGVTMTFSLISFFSLLLLTDLKFLKLMKGVIKWSYRGGRGCFILIRMLYKKAFKEEFSTSEIIASVETLAPYKKQPIEEEVQLLPLENAAPAALALPLKKRPRKFFQEEENPEPPADTFAKIRFPRRKRSLAFVSEEYRHYQLPPLSLLTSARKADHPSLKKDLKRQAEILEETLYSFGIEAKVGDINSGPTITSFEVHPAIGVKVQKIKALENDIALNLQAKSIRIIAPIPGKAAVGVEIPSQVAQEVGFKEMLVTYQQQRRRFDIPILLGKTVSGEDVMCDLTKMPHCIIAGATGSGKSVCINTIIMSILMNAHPEEIKLILIDPKKVELTSYSPLPHMIAPVITEPHGAYAALNWLVKEMQHRYEILKQLSLRNIEAFNSREVNEELEEALDIQIPRRMPWIVMIIDEFADLMMTSSSDLETPIARIAQMARAVGIHLILATQRPSREVITGLIKANFPTRISFKVSSRINSQIILDENGAESLLGNGDLLFLPPGTSQLIRAQGVYVRDEDINQVIQFICSQASANYLIKSFDRMSREDLFPEEGISPKDTLYDKALEIVVETKNASTTFLQRKLKIGYARAASLMDELESRGVIGPQEGSKPRKVLYSKYDNQ